MLEAAEDNTAEVATTNPGLGIARVRGRTCRLLQMTEQLHISSNFCFSDWLVMGSWGTQAQ
ncbi:hypothetical protein CCR75_008384 [Bremia lactucae]|uniref:Uncharacterized protein n=1 Tax=Bremia lactucae TaxID=4779 RepID=A0A976NYU7_BRELC|nr:hypothetical protein CCR75_008384 [Bremia lactucae]